MQKYLFIPFLSLLSLSLLAKEPNINVSLQQYWHPESGPYIELSYFAEASTLLFEEDGVGFKSAIEFTALFISGEDIVAYDKVKLESLVTEDTTSFFSIIGLSRVAVPEGDWLLEVHYNDVNNADQVFTLQDSVHIAAPTKTSISSLMITELRTPSQDWVRYGYSCFPRSRGQMTYFPDEDTILQFYTEVYQPESGSSAIATFGIYDASTGGLVEGFNGATRLKSIPFQPFSKKIDLRKLPTGSYMLKFNVLDSEGEIIVADAIFFGRRNSRVALPMVDLAMGNTQESYMADYTSVEDLKFLADCLYPMLGSIERIQCNTLVNEGDSIKLRRYVSAFWANHSPQDPGAAFKEYMTRVHQIDELYSGGTLRGYQSDMGRVRLQYGDPTQLEDMQFESGTYPYQIWQYDQLTSPNKATQTNRIFIFVNRRVAGNSYELIHSNAYGEIHDPQWKYRVVRGGNTTNPDINSSDYNDSQFGSRLNNNSIINGGTSNAAGRR